MNLTFTVPGIPRPKPRMTRRDQWKQRPIVVNYRDYADRIRAALIDAKRVSGISDEFEMDGPIAVDLTFVTRKGEERTIVKIWQLEGALKPRAGDIDNFCKSVLEAMQPFNIVPILIKDDKQVITLTARIEQ